MQKRRFYMSCHNVSTPDFFYCPSNSTFPTQQDDSYTEWGDRNFVGVQVEQHVRIYTQIQTLTGSYDTLAHQASAVNALYMANPPNPLPLFPQYVQPNPYLHST